MDVFEMSDLRQIEAAVTPRRGWDFSRMQTEREPVPWEYLEVVPNYLMPQDAVLDIGTGGGEKLLALSQHFGQGVGVDPNPEMIHAARENGAGQANVTFEEMAAEALAFPDASFAVVLNRHAPIDVSEVVRVLKPGGYFVTQQVGDHNMANICEEFGTEPVVQYADRGALDDESHQKLIEAFTHHGCRLLTSAGYDVHYWVKDIPSLIFWLKAIAGGKIPAVFSIDRHGPVVKTIIEKYATAKGVVTNEHRTLLIAQKPS